MKLITLVLVATFLTLSSLCVQGSPEDGLSRWKDQSVQQPADDPLLRWMNKIAQQELQARENAIAQIRTVADAERRKQVVREEILQILGGLPDYNGPLHARIIPAAARAAKLIVSATFSLLAKLQSSAARASSFLVKVDVARR